MRRIEEEFEEEKASRLMEMKKNFSGTSLSLADEMRNSEIFPEDTWYGKLFHYFSNSSLLIFYKDWRIRKLCLLLVVTPPKIKHNTKSFKSTATSVFDR